MGLEASGFHPKAPSFTLTVSGADLEISGFHPKASSFTLTVPGLDPEASGFRRTAPLQRTPRRLQHPLCNRVNP